jgi:YD repeat-containing protein
MVTFDKKPLRMETIGLVMQVPEGAAIDSTSAGTTSTTRVVPSDGTWVLNIQTPRTSNPALTTVEVMDDIAEQVLKMSGQVLDPKGNVIGVPGRVIERTESLRIGDRDASRFYAELTPASTGVAVVNGYTVFKLSESQFVTFELLTSKDRFDTARGAYETVVATARFEDMEAIATSRQAAVNTGLALFQTLTPEVMDEVIRAQPERWDRLYRPARTGVDADAEEVAYRRTRFSRGRRGELDPLKPVAQYNATDRAEGYVVRIDSRFLQKPGTVDQVIGDTMGIFWMSPDRSEEAWTVRQTIRRGADVQTFVETGARKHRAMTVSVHGDGIPEKVLRPLIEGEGYVSRVEYFLLPALLIRSRTPADFAFYCFQSESSRIRLRRDTLAEDPGRPGFWTLTTRQHEDADPQVARYDDKGRLVSATLPDGTVWEPIEFGRLVQLWRRKNLPMD